MRCAALACALLLLGGCAEMREPAPLPPPSPLSGVSADPARAAIEATQRDFADRGAALAGKPAVAALALARLEYLTNELGRNPRFAPMPEGLRREMLLARSETRDAMGIAESATPEAVMPALASAAEALRLGNAARAAAALPAPLFRPGGARSVARLAELGPLPQASLATALLAQEATRLDASTGWIGRPETEPEIAGVTFGQRSGITAGY